MTTQLLSEITGKTVVCQLLEMIDDWDLAFPVKNVVEAMEALQISDPDILYEQLTSEGLLSPLGGDSLSFTTKGRKTLLLLQALNGADIRDVHRRLSALYPSWSKYEVVRERMTQEFIRELYDRPDFRRIYLCSRWMHLEKRPRARLAQAVHWASGHNPVEILAIHGPIQPGSARDAEMVETLNFLKSLGADVVINPKVHAKLYIREPGLSGGTQVAVVGSENLTVPKYLELGLKIVNDGELIDKLIGFFFEIYAGQSF